MPEGLLRLQAGRGSSGSSTVSTSVAEDFWKNIKDSAEAILGTATDVKVTVSPMTGSVFVRGPAARVREVEDFVKGQQEVAFRQVLIEAKIVEVSLDDGFQAGVNWSAANTRGNVAGGLLPGGGNVNPGASTLAAGPLTFTSAARSAAPPPLASGGEAAARLAMKFANWAAALSFLETQGSTHVLSSPRLATLNNQKAILRVGETQAYATGASASTAATPGSTATVTTPTVTTQDFFSGVSFDITPQVGSDGMVTLHVRPQLTNVQQKILNVDLGSAGAVSMPTAASSIQDADTIIRIGGCKPKPPKIPSRQI